ncbi:MAG: fumarate hydratase [Oscillospiraceae bacterium]|nr:fumarate hydratase [Oscillospiraceae bacterium]
MREVHSNLIMNAVRRLWVEANTTLGEDIRTALARAAQQEGSPLGREILEKVLENDQMAWTQGLPISQDPGMAVVYVRLGQEVHITGGFLADAVNEGIRRGQAEGHFRGTMVSDPLERIQTGDNCPARLRVELTAGDGLEITVAPAGYEGENATLLQMLSPISPKKSVMDVVIQAVKAAGTTPCPPFIVGVGLGGTAEEAAELSRKALLLPLGERHPSPEYARLEEELEKQCNGLGIGPQGLGGTTTVLGAHILSKPTHVGCLPCAVSLESYATRRATEIL